MICRKEIIARLEKLKEAGGMIERSFTVSEEEMSLNRERGKHFWQGFNQGLQTAIWILSEKKKEEV